MKAKITILFLCLTVGRCFGQDMINLNKYIKDEKLIDLGYGLERQDYINITDSLFTLNRFADTAIYFRQIKSDTADIMVYGNDISVQMPITSTGYQKFIKVYGNGQLMVDFNYTDQSAQYPLEAYFVRYKEQYYFIRFYRTNSSASTTTNVYDFDMVDLNSFKVLNPPAPLSTHSLLCFTDYNGDGRLDYIDDQVRWRDEVYFYLYTKGKWTIDSRYLIKVQRLDGFVCNIKQSESKLPPLGKKRR